jgi:hypothetical protein
VITIARPDYAQDVLRLESELKLRCRVDLLGNKVSVSADQGFASSRFTYRQTRLSQNAKAHIGLVLSTVAINQVFYIITMCGDHARKRLFSHTSTPATGNKVIDNNASSSGYL